MTLGVWPRLSLLVALLGLALGSVGCSGGSASTGSVGFDCTTPTGEAAERVLCLVSCNLGCSTTGCARTDIAQNEIIRLTFSEKIDVNSVNSSSIRFRTASGDLPVGEFLVTDNRVEFVPTVSISGGQTFLGFTSGETYTMTIIGGTGPAVVRGTSGRPFAATLTCTLQSTNGIVDLNGSPPRAALTLPTSSQVEAAPLETDIEIEFNELIDATPFVSGSQSPVEFRVRKTKPAVGGGSICDADALAFVIAGVQTLTYDAGRGVSILTFRPAQDLPGNVCVEISVTDGVRDLSGRSAQPQLLTFKTVEVPLVETAIEETFDDNLQFDEEASAGSWESGEVSFAQIGGDGRHGDFLLSMATNTGDFDAGGRQIYTLNCNGTIIPGSNTFTGDPVAVSDGKFYFTSMVVPASARVRFVGTVPPIVTVAGRLDIQGVLENNGMSLTTLPAPSTVPGQEGAEGGCYGGHGGDGGKRSPGEAPLMGDLEQYQGQDGEAVRVIGAHGYLASVPATAGKGSDMFPASGLDDDMLFAANPPIGLQYALSATAGGSGGGLFAAGAEGRVLAVLQNLQPIANEASYKGPASQGGASMQLFPYPAAGLQKSSQHFALGGAGGGGAGSACTMSLSIATARNWAPGAGGGGGGGPIVLRVGRSLRVGPDGAIQSMGGSAADNGPATAAGPQLSPGGGGAGGSVVLLSGGSAEVIGAINVSGGKGGMFDRTAGGGFAPNGGVVRIEGGDGSPGFVRLETPAGPDVGALAQVTPAVTGDSVGVLQESDDVCAVRSKFYSTGLVFGPSWARYEIYATVDGVPMVFSDDADVSTMEARQGAPVRALFQAGDIDLTTGEVLSTGPWREGVATTATTTGLDGLNGFRFLLQIDRTIATTVTVDRVVVVFKN